MIAYIIAFLIVTYVIFMVVGFIFITYGMFNLATATVPKTIKDAVLTQYIKGKKTDDKDYTLEKQKIELGSLPDIEVEEPTGKLNMTLSSNEIMAGKVTLISIWVLIIIGIMFALVAIFS